LRAIRLWSKELTPGDRPCDIEGVDRPRPGGRDAPHTGSRTTSRRCFRPPWWPHS